jgi:hypothetical protein
MTFFPHPTHPFNWVEVERADILSPMGVSSASDQKWDQTGWACKADATLRPLVSKCELQGGRWILLLMTPAVVLVYFGVNGCSNFRETHVFHQLIPQHVVIFSADLYREHPPFSVTVTCGNPMDLGPSVGVPRFLGPRSGELGRRCGQCQGGLEYDTCREACCACCAWAVTSTSSTSKVPKGPLVMAMKQRFIFGYPMAWRYNLYAHDIIPICSVLEDLPTKRADIVWINLGKYSSTEMWDRNG